MNKTTISYLTHTWNPIGMRCTPCSPGCDNCWHLAMENRFAQAGCGVPTLREKELTAPLRRKKPARIGTMFMGDLFHEDVPTTMIDRVYEVMENTKQHAFLVLTKRPQNIEEKLYGATVDNPCRQLGGGDYLSNVWLGVTVCNQAEADAKIPVLLSIPAAVRWLSIEPMLAPVGSIQEQLGLDWVVVGCESGPRRRPCNIEWVRSVVGQCKAASVPVYVKQLDIGGKCVDDIALFPEDLRIREYPEIKP